MTHPLSGNWNYPTAIRFGAGRVRELPELCRSVGIARPLLVTDRGLASLPMIAEAAGALGCPVFADVHPNPSLGDVEAGIAVFREGGHDGVVAFGGGSALDAGKAVAFAAGQSRPLFDFEDVGDNWTRADPAGIAPTVAVPTTSGTGSEVGRVSVVTDEAAHVKRLVFHPRLQPVAVICDPALTLGLPSAITAATGMDALAHLIEAYCAPGFHPMADGIAVEGMRLVRDWLPVAVRDGANLEARSWMMAASTMGATAFQKGLGAVHSLAHPIGARHGTHHGLLNGVLMPYVLAHNAPAIGARMDALAYALALPEPGLAGVIAWIETLRRQTGIPATLAELGLDGSDADVVAAAALADPSTPGNPLPLDQPALRRLYLAAVHGKFVV